MLNIVACFKWVVDDADIKVDAGSKKLNLDRAAYKISAYDRNAIEEAVLLQEKHGGSVVAMTVAQPGAKPCLKDSLSRGPDSACFINDPCCSNLEPSQTVDILAGAIKAKEYDLIICGEGSGDIYAQQVGPSLAEKLGIPCVTWVNKLSYNEDEKRIIEERKLEVGASLAEKLGIPCVTWVNERSYNEDEKRIIAERKLEDGVEVVSVPLPALVVVLPDINTARIPTLKQVLGASKKPVENVGPQDFCSIPSARLETVDVVAATMDRRRVKLSADADGIREAVNALLREGVIS
jgi:electron transfer flavoprotein beta subunit